MGGPDGTRLLPRRAAEVASESLTAFRVLVLHGARQVGKTTLARVLAKQMGAAYVTMDRADDQAVAAADPATFLQAYGTPAETLAGRVDIVPLWPLALTAMVRLLAATTGKELVLSTIAHHLALDRGTVQTYEPWLETVFLVYRVPAWSRNLTAKVIRRPKLYLTDTGSPPACWARTPSLCSVPPTRRLAAVRNLRRQ